MPAARFLIQAPIVLLQVLLAVWTLCLPLAWLLRDGLGPDSQETGWITEAGRTLARWGIPALAIAVPLVGLTWLRRRIAGDAVV
jgi:hypothetical protein